ncbi:NUMOD3 domain-containing DNA-binding protein [Acinetobacter baumannii]
MESGIYRIVNVNNGKCYVGSTKNFESRWNRHFRDLEKGNHCNIKLQRSYNKHGKHAFKTEILEKIEYTRDLIIERENYWINKLNSKIEGYNIADASFGDAISNHPNKEEIIKRRSDTAIKNNSKLTKEERSLKWGKYGKSNPMFGKNHSEETKAKISEINKGNQYSKGRIMSDSQKAKLSEIAKLRIGELNPFYGKTHSKESRAKMSEKAKGRQPSNTRPVVVDGVLYSCRREASENTGIKESTIWHRCNSKNKKYIDTYFID